MQKMRHIRFQNGKKEVICKILNLAGGSLLFIGQKGTVIRRSAALERESETVWDLCTKPQVEYCQCRKMRMATFSVTDATYLDVSRHYCIATSNRSLHFLHVTSSDQWETFRLVDMPTIPICLENNFKESNNRQTCELFVGDHIGNIYIFTFLFPRTMLFDRKYTTDIQTIHFDNLKNHRDYVICRRLKNVHNDFVDKILHVPQSNVLLSNAKRDSKKSLVMQKLNAESSMKVFHHAKGVTCFDVDFNKDLIASGGKDFLIRLWKFNHSDDSVLTLYGHCAVIADIRFCTERQLLLSICKELELKVWDPKSGHLIRSVLTKFANLRREPYLGNSVLYVPDKQSEYFLVTCSDSSIQIHIDKLLDDDNDLFCLEKKTAFDPLIFHSKSSLCSSSVDKAEEINSSGSENEKQL